jgi:hypothetical protein
MKENIEQILSGICPNCEKESTFNYIGEQEMFKKPVIQLYDCNSCKSSIDLVHISNKKPIQ